MVDLLKQVGIFMVCSQTILHFRPHQKYEKYLKLLVGIMVIAQLVTPLLGLFPDCENFETKAYGGEEKVGLEIDRVFQDADEILNKYMNIEIKSRLNNDSIEDLGVDE